MGEVLPVQMSARAKNDAAAKVNRNKFHQARLAVVNYISSPGSGKTALLEAMAKKWGKKLGVVTGDIQTTYDADRLLKAGAQAVQIETGGTCHLTADMVARSVERMDLSTLEILVIENIGNLVCPATYDLGEDFKVALLSVTEGDEKPIKYPALFQRAHAVVFTKMDLLPHVTFDIERAQADCRKLNPDVKFFRTSATTGEGLEKWFAFLAESRRSSTGK